MAQKWYLPSENDNKGKKIAYVNARIVDPESGLDEKGTVITEGGVIADFGATVGKDGLADDIEQVDCEGHVLCPGLIDLQVHFRDPGQHQKESIVTGSKSTVAGGITSVVCMPNTIPTLDNAALIEYVVNKARDEGYCRVHPYGAITNALGGDTLSEMSQMKDAGAVGFTDDGLPVMNSLVMRRALEYAKMLDVPIAQHAEDTNLSNGGCINEGKVSSKLGVRGIPNASESITVTRDIELLRLTGGHYHVLHVSTREAMHAIRAAKEDGLNITCEIAPHHFTLTDEAVLEHQGYAKMNPPLRSQEDVDVLLEALADGTADAIATDHAPHESEAKEVPVEEAAFGIVGVETMLPLSLELYHQKKLSLIDVLAKMTNQPADIIRQPTGRIKKGAPADLALIDLDLKWTIEREKFASLSKNSPFDGRNVTGRVIRTVLDGKTVYTL